MAGLIIPVNLTVAEKESFLTDIDVGIGVVESTMMARVTNAVVVKWY